MTTPSPSSARDISAAFADGCDEARAVIAVPQSSYLDMPLPTLVASGLLALALASTAWCSSAVPMVIVAIVVLPGLILIFGALSVPGDPAAGIRAQARALASETGRLWTCVRAGRPQAALRRLRRHDRQVSKEWRRITATAWAIWIAVVIQLALLWSTVR